MSFAVIGLGSMGKRRIRLIKKIVTDAVILGVDNNIERQIEAKDKCGIKTFDTLESINENISAAFICTSPLTHSKIINECLQKELMCLLKSIWLMTCMMKILI